jgi:hypothetical protein
LRGCFGNLQSTAAGDAAQRFIGDEERQVAEARCATEARLVAESEFVGFFGRQE